MPRPKPDPVEAAARRKASHLAWRNRNREKLNHYSREWYRNNAKDPAFCARVKERNTTPEACTASRARSAQQRADPVKYAEMKAKQNVKRKAALRGFLTWPQAAFHHSKGKARKAGIAFNLAVDDFIIPALCPVFGAPFVLGSLNHPQGPSIDRLDPALGYTRGNVRVISRRANTLKSDCVSAAELRAVAAYMEREGLL